MKAVSQSPGDTCIGAGDTDLADVVRFHGHMCPGLAIGYRAARIIMERLGSFRAEDEELVAIVENDSCSVDAVQWITGCTFGKGNFVFRDYGKQVFTVALRPSGRALRVALKRREFRIGEPPHEDREARIQWLLTAPEDLLFHVEEIHLTLPDVAQIRDSSVCDRCGEESMVTRVVHAGPRTLCIPCSKLADQQ
ncbi:MAG TPA: formylmethanofuran dehydrogenase [Syntrophobacteraceae bacterium]|nr:formylmethanofuran dehydrogenase [Syntrophobacteraceae bacterium]